MDVADKIIGDIIVREGGYVDHSADRGGPTNFGVTQAVLARWRGTTVTRDDVKNMRRAEAEDIYRAEYIRPFLFAQDDGPLLAHLIDCSVNHGVGGATKILQRALGVAADGSFGAKSMAAYRAADKALLADRLVAQRAMYYARIVKSDPSQAVFIEGWMKRCMEFLVGAVL